MYVETRISNEPRLENTLCAKTTKIMTLFINLLSSCHGMTRRNKIADPSAALFLQKQRSKTLARGNPQNRIHKHTETGVILQQPMTK